MAEFEQRSDISNLPLKRITLSAVWRTDYIGRKTGKEAIEIIQVNYNGGSKICEKWLDLEALSY